MRSHTTMFQTLTNYHPTHPPAPPSPQSAVTPYATTVRGSCWT